MPTDNYELARQIIEAAPQAEFILPPYTGSTSDLAYLKQWVLGQVTAIYGVDPTLFDTSTVVSTTILRDFVHRALYQTTTPNYYTDVFASPDFLGYNDVAQSFRYPMWGVCSELAWQEWQVFRAFGYQTNDISTINADLGTWTDGHTMTQVYVSDLGKYIIQDATFNFLYRDATGTVLSFDEARQANIGGTLQFDGFANYRFYKDYGAPEAEINQQLQEYFRQHYLETTYWWYDANGTRTSTVTELFLDSSAPHDPGTYQGGVFDSAVDAVSAVTEQHALTPEWLEIAAAIRGLGFYVSGFATADGDGTRVAEYLTIRLASGRYLSIDIATNTTLNGSFDQISAEAFGGAENNPGQVLSAFTGPIYLLSAAGVILNAGVAPTIPTDIIGTSSADTLVGSPAVDRIVGGEGNDVLRSMGGADYVAGGNGNDVYVVTGGTEWLIEIAGQGIDTVYANFDYALPENFEILSLTGAAIRGTGNYGEYWLNGNDNDNILFGKTGIGHLAGGAGNDTYFVGSSSATVYEIAGEGSDTVITNVDFTLAVGSEIEVLQTYGSNTTPPVTLIGNERANTIVGNDAANIIDGRGGADLLWGYGGDDTYYVDNSGDRVVELNNSGNDTIITSVSVALDASSEVETIKTHGSRTTHVINLTGSSIANTLVGNAADNVIDGRGGADFMWGYGGNDTYYVDNSGDRVVELAGGGNDTIITRVSVTLDPTSEVETLQTYGSATTLAINLIGSNIANTLVGNDGANIIDGRGGADLMWGYGGNDSYYVDDSGDRVVELAGGGTDIIFTSVSIALDAMSEVETIQTYGSATTQTINLTGSDISNTLVGNAAANIIDGRGGADLMWGYGGNDTYYVDNSADRVIELSGGGNDTIITNVSISLDPSSEVETIKTYGSATTQAIDILGSDTPNTLIGNSAVNTIDGRNGNDIIWGFAGDDRLIGGLGNDTLNGGVGGDTFVFDAALDPAGNMDTIQDFSAGIDRIELDATIFAALPSGLLASTSFVVGTAAQTADQHVIYDPATGALFYDSDGNGAGAMVQFAVLSTNPALSYGDFLVA